MLARLQTEASWDVYLPLLFDSFMSMVSRFGNKAHFKTVIGLFPVFSLRWEFYLCEPHMSGYRFLKLSRWVSFGWKRWHTMPFCLRYSSDLMVTAHQECVCVLLDALSKLLFSLLNSTGISSPCTVHTFQAIGRRVSSMDLVKNKAGLCWLAECR